MKRLTLRETRRPASHSLLACVGVINDPPEASPEVKLWALLRWRGRPSAAHAAVSPDAPCRQPLILTSDCDCRPATTWTPVQGRECRPVSKYRLRRSVATALPFPYRDERGNQRSLDLTAGSLAFTFRPLPVVHHRGDAPGITAHPADGTTVDHPDSALSLELSASIFRWEGRVSALTVRVPEGRPAQPAASAHLSEFQPRERTTS